MDGLMGELRQYDQGVHVVHVIDRIRATDLSDEEKRNALRQWAGSVGVTLKSWALEAVTRPVRG